jgi:hypothetical protein
MPTGVAIGHGGADLWSPSRGSMKSYILSLFAGRAEWPGVRVDAKGHPDGWFWFTIYSSAFSFPSSHIYLMITIFPRGRKDCARRLSQFAWH